MEHHDVGGTHVRLDDPALRELYAQHAHRVHRLCRRLLGNSSDAEDAMQESFSRIAPLLGGLSGDPAAYLTTVARNVCYGMRRSKARDRRLAAASAAAEKTVEPDTVAINRYMVRMAMNGLTSRDRNLLSLTFAGFSYDEIARRTGATAAAVSMSISRARRAACRSVGRVAGVAFAPLVGWRRRVVRHGEALPQPVANLMATFQHCGLIGAALLSALGAASPPAIAGFTAKNGGARPSAPATGTAEPAAEMAPSGLNAATTEVAASPAPRSSPSMAPLAVLAQPATQRWTATPEESWMQSETESPNYSRDHTVYASGSLVDQCFSPAQGCPVLFATTDEGRSWTQLPAQGFGGGRIVAAPTVAGPPLLYASGAQGVQESTDGGGSFHLVAPMGQAPTVAADPAGGYDVVFGLTMAGTAVAWSPREHTVRTAASLPPGSVGPVDVASLGDDEHLLLTAYRPALTGYVNEVDLCRAPAPCETVATVATASPLLRLATSPSFADDHTVVAYTADVALVSTDGGAHFTRVSLPSRSGSIAALRLADDGSRGAAWVLSFLSPRGASLFTTTDGGQSFQAIGANGLQGLPVVQDVLVLPDGRYLVALGGGPSDGFGMRCSTDGGATWPRRC